jgi:membrane associated rhomboid family serine protease
MHFQRPNIGPKNTPKVIKAVIILTALFSILSATIPNMYFFKFFGLSFEGIKTGFIWQILTNLFIIPNQKISFSFVFHLVFNLYMLWVFGTAIIDLKGKNHLISIFLVTGILSSTVALFLTPFIFAGANILIYSFAFAWLMLHKDARLLLFFSIPVKAKWLILGVMGINLLSLLSSYSLDYFFSYLTSFALTYFYALLIWKTFSPFPFLKNFEKSVIHLLKKIFSKKNFYSSKIFDFKTGKSKKLSDKEFLDKILEKISIHGKSSLTKRELKKLNKISKKSKNF